MSAFQRAHKLAQRYDRDFVVLRDRRNKKRDQFIPSGSRLLRTFSRRRWFVAVDTASIEIRDGQLVAPGGVR